jgi:hypothetical protein
MAGVQAWTWIQHHRWLSVTFLAIVVIGTAGGTCWAVFFRTVASPVSLKDALKMYRHESTASDSPASVLAPGVYAYTTTGGEQLSLPGADRSFPSATDMVVSGSGSCSTVEWVPLVQHTESTTVCSAANHALDVTRFVTYEQISGTTATTVVTCPAGTYFIPPNATTGTRWTTTCHQVSPSEPVEVQGQVVGTPTLVIGGQSVSTVHVVLNLIYRGTDSGPAPSQFWVDTARREVVREEERATISQGGINYAEEMTTLLDSLVPQS